jgi:cytosine/adenosine deaminase-related metal-dependent hydrolase
VHAVAAGLPELDLIRKRAAHIIWCPGSNLFTLGKTLSRDVIRSGVPISLATDSGITANGDLIDEIRIAQETTALNANEIYELVTTNPARALRLSKGHGTIRRGGVADLVAVKDHGQTPAGALMKLDPQLVLIGGRIMLSSDRFAELTGTDFRPIDVEGRGRRLVRADIPRLYSSAAVALGPEIRLAGRLIVP